MPSPWMRLAKTNLFSSFDFDLPFVNGDINFRPGFPSGVTRFDHGCVRHGGFDTLLKESLRCYTRGYGQRIQGLETFPCYLAQGEAQGTRFALMVQLTSSPDPHVSANPSLFFLPG